MKQIRIGFLGAIMTAACICSAGSIDVSFATDVGIPSDGANPPDGWTYSSIGKSDNAAGFNKVGDYILSPTYEHTLTNITIECKCSNAEATRLLRVVPLVADGDNVATNNDAIAVFEAKSDQKRIEQVTFAPELGINAVVFELTGSGTKGNWTVYSATILHTGLEPLKAAGGLRNETVTTNSFKAVWDAVEAAENYAVKVWNEYETEPTFGTLLFEEKFDRATNATTSAKSIVDKPGRLEQNTNEGWEGDVVYTPPNSVGVIQVGKGSSPGDGWLMTPALPGGNEGGQSLIIRAMRPAGTKHGELAPIALVRGDVTNDLGVISLDTSWKYYDIPIADLAAGDRILFHSITNESERRVFLDGVWVASGFEPGVWVTNEIDFAEGLTTTEHMVTNLALGTYHWKVRSDATGEEGLWSGDKVVEIKETNDGTTNGGDSGGSSDGIDFTSNAWRISQMADWAEVADFSMVTNVEKATDWSNGLSIPGFYAFKNGVEETQIRANSRKATIGGLYASYTNNYRNVTTYSLSLLGGGSAEMTLVLPICNDNPGGKILIGATIGFTAYQWTFKGEGSEERNFFVEWAVTDKEHADSLPGDDEWNVAEDLTFVSVPTLDEKATHRQEDRVLTLSGIEVPPDGMLLIRWRVEKETKGVMFGLGNVGVTDVRFKRLPTLIRLR